MLGGATASHIAPSQNQIAVDMDRRLALREIAAHRVYPARASTRPSGSTMTTFLNSVGKDIGAQT